MGDEISTGRAEALIERLNFGIRGEYLAQKLPVRDVALHEFSTGSNGSFNLHRAMVADVVDGRANLLEIDPALAEERTILFQVELANLSLLEAWRRISGEQRMKRALGAMRRMRP